MSENSAFDDTTLLPDRLPISAVFGLTKGPDYDWPRLWLLQHRELARLMVPRIAGHAAGALLAVIVFFDDLPLPLMALWLAWVWSQPLRLHPAGSQYPAVRQGRPDRA